MFAIREIETGIERESEVLPVWRYGVWECGAFRITDEDGTLYESVTPPAPPPAEDKRITRLAFRKRFTQAEKIAIEMAALDDPTAAIEQRTRAAALRVDMKDTDSATFIDLGRQDTREGVIALQLLGLLGDGRAFEILDAPIEEKERPQ